MERISAVVESQESFEKYLQVKREKMGHLDDAGKRSGPRPECCPKEMASS